VRSIWPIAALGEDRESVERIWHDVDDELRNTFIATIREKYTECAVSLISVAIDRVGLSYSMG
jgi:hypothetical protein